MNLAIWFWLCMKRQLKKPFFWLQLLLLPCAAFFYRQASSQETGLVQVALVLEEEGPAREAAELLLAREGALSFYLCDTEEELLADVMSCRAECGFIFREGFQAGLERGKLRRVITLVKSPATVAGELASEAVSGAVMRLVGADGLMRLAEQDFFAPAAGEDTQQELSDLYEHFLTDGSTFSFEYETVDGAAQQPRQWEQNVFPVRGLAAVLLFAAALSGGAAVFQDEERGIYNCMSGGQKPLGIWLSVLAPLLPVSACCLLAIGLSGGLTGWGREIIAMGLYCLAASAAAAALRLFLTREKIYCAAIPALLMGSLIFCPVIIDFGRILPAAAILQRLFLPYYYLIIF